ncbi:MAG: SGNH/GDSL hydrolase family protein [bacterium]|nr:SGNH/GDSL hydrolase family protein [bacterium]
MAFPELIRRLGVAVIALLVSLLITEVAVRIHGRSNTFYDLEMSRYALEVKESSTNPSIGHVHRAGARARLMDVQVEINSDGFRDHDYSIEKPPGTRRLVFLGDSLTFGWGVESDQTFEARLERILNDESPTEVLNFGTGNYNTEQSVHLFFEKGLRYQPDGVVVFYFINDAEETPARSKWMGLGHSRAVTFFWSRIQAALSNLGWKRSFQDTYSSLYGDDSPGWVKAKQAFDELSSVCDRNGIDLKVVILPELHQLVDYPFAAEHELLHTFLDQQGIEYLDLVPFFANESNPRRFWVAPDDAHPNTLGHERIAVSTAPFLTDEQPTAD